MELFDFSTNVPLQEISLPGVEDKVSSLYMKRLDLIHPVYGGNKAYKLKYHIRAAIENNSSAILSYGGPFSNHLYALAGLGKELGIRTIGIIRGFSHYAENPTLSFCLKSDMELKFLSPEKFNDRKIRNELIDEFQNKMMGPLHEVPEGGSDELGVIGASEILNSEEILEFSHFCTGLGTGGTMAGLIRATNGKGKVLGFSALKGAGYLDEIVDDFTRKYPKNWQILHDYHFGGFAKQNTETKAFKSQFEQINGIEIDPVYQVKMLLGLQDLLKKQYFSNKDKILIMHTGGIQATAGHEYLANRKLKN